MCWLNPGSKLKWLMWTNALWQAKDKKSLKIVKCPPFPTIIQWQRHKRFVRGRILGRNWNKSLKSFSPCYSRSPLLQILLPPPLSKGCLKLVCNVIVYGNLKSENSQDYAQKPQRNCTLMNSASGVIELKKGTVNKQFYIVQNYFLNASIFLG
jgi:hypothetical protein